MEQTSLRAYRKYVGETIRTKLDKDWRIGMDGKVTLTRYRKIEGTSKTYTITQNAVAFSQIAELGVCKRGSIVRDTPTSKRLAPNAEAKKKPWNTYCWNAKNPPTQSAQYERR